MILVIEGFVMCVMNLCDGFKKMFKLGEFDMECINMIDIVDIIVKKFKKVKFDLELLLEIVDGLLDCLEVWNFVNIYVVLNDQINEQVIVEFGGEGWGKFKLVFVDLVVFKLVLILEEMLCLMVDKVEIDCILICGVDCVCEIVQLILCQMYDIVGLLCG